MRKVFFAIPSHSGMVPVGTMMSIIQSMSDLTSMGIAIEVRCHAGDSLVTHARNALVAMFMASDCTDLVFIDSDICWESDAMLRLLTHKCDLVCGMYRFKNDDENYPFRYFQNTATVINPETGEPSANGVIEVESVPLGFSKISRSAMEMIWEATKDKTFIHGSLKDYICHRIFYLEYTKDEGQEHGRDWGEDFLFCRQFRELGGKVYVDPDIKLGHIGLKVYAGDFDRWLRTRHEPPPVVITQQKIREVFSHPDYDELDKAVNGR